MDFLEELRLLGVNTEEAVQRMAGNVSLYERMLGKFANMIDDSIVKPDFDLNNYNNIIDAAHAIKGASGNLSITPVYEAYTEIVRLLREKQPELAKEEIEKVIPVQNEIVDCIRKHS